MFIGGYFYCCKYLIPEENIMKAIKRISFTFGISIFLVIWIIAPAGAVPCNTDPIIGCSSGNYSFRTFDADNGTGLGNYNIILYEQGGGGQTNASGTVNVDNSDTASPTGSITQSNSLFWYTSAGDLQAFYSQQFPGPNPINNIVLFLDINEQGGIGNTIDIITLNIIQNPTTVTPDPGNPAISDIQSSAQNAITGFTGGTLLASLGVSPITLTQMNVGGGQDDWAIFTGIDPFSLPSSTRLLFQLVIGDIDNGGEVVSLSGEFRGCEPNCPTTTATSIPEPSSMFLLGSGLIVLAKVGRRKRDKESHAHV
jgi:hypothetical protein